MTSTAILDASRCGDKDRVFVLGSYDRRVTIYNQQVRALNLVHGLCESELVGDESSVAVVGAGIGGLTVAAGLASKGISVSVLEAAASPLWLFQGASHLSLIHI